MGQETFLPRCNRSTNVVYLTYIPKASKVHNFLRRNAQTSLVRPILEYASSVYDPYQYNKIYIIGRIQHRATHWSLCNYGRYNSLTLVQHQLNWQSLQQH